VSGNGLAPMLFDDADKEEAETLRSSAVAQGRQPEAQGDPDRLLRDRQKKLFPSSPSTTDRAAPETSAETNACPNRNDPYRLYQRQEG
jgi:hypothetical protein